MQWLELGFIRRLIRKSPWRFMKSSNFLNQTGGRALREKSRLWKKLTMNAWQSYMKDLNHTNRYSWWWNTSMEDLFMDIWKENQIDKWQKSRPNSFGNRLFSEFTICIKGTSHIEISSWRTSFWMRPELVLNWSILDFQPASLMKRRSRSSAEHHLIWRQRLSVKSSMQDHRQMSGRSASCFSPFSVADSHSKVKMTKNCIQIFVDRIYQWLTISQDKLNNY